MYAYLYIHSCINLCRFLEAVKCLSPSIDIWLHIILTAQPVLPRRRWFTTFIAPILPAHLRSPWAACTLLRHTTVSSLGPLTSDDPWGVELFISCPAGDSHPSMKVFISPTFHDLSCFLLMTGWPLRVTSVDFYLLLTHIQFMPQCILSEVSCLFMIQACSNSFLIQVDF